MVATRLGLEGYGVRRASLFANKIEAPIIEPAPDQPRIYPPYPGLGNLTVAQLLNLKANYQQILRWARKTGSRNKGTIRGTDIRRCQDKIREIDVELRSRKPIRSRSNF